MDMGAIVGVVVTLLFAVIFSRLFSALAAMNIAKDPAPEGLRDPTPEEIEHFMRSYCPTGASIYSKKLMKKKQELIKNIKVIDGIITQVHDSGPTFTELSSVTYDVQFNGRVYSHKECNFVDKSYKELKQIRHITGYFLRREDGEYYYLTFGHSLNAPSVE